MEGNTHGLSTEPAQSTGSPLPSPGPQAAVRVHLAAGSSQVTVGRKPHITHSPVRISVQLPPTGVVGVREIFSTPHLITMAQAKTMAWGMGQPGPSNDPSSPMSLTYTPASCKKCQGMEQNLASVQEGKHMTENGQEYTISLGHCHSFIHSFSQAHIHSGNTTVSQLLPLW